MSNEAVNVLAIAIDTGIRISSTLNHKLPGTYISLLCYLIFKMNRLSSLLLYWSFKWRLRMIKTDYIIYSILNDLLFE